jgi:hypothetical protein
LEDPYRAGYELSGFRENRMAAGPNQNEYNLAPQPHKERPTLDQMRKKLASGPPAPAAAPPVPGNPAKRKRRSKSVPWMAAIAAILVAANVMGLSRKDAVLEIMGVQNLSEPISPPPNLSLDERARFWAYAAYDQAALRAHYKLPPSGFLDPEDAGHHVEDLLTQGLGPKVRDEILALRARASKGEAR